jgi:hypothetical protein
MRECKLDKVSFPYERPSIPYPLAFDENVIRLILGVVVLVYKKSGLFVGKYYL